MAKNSRQLTVVPIWAFIKAMKPVERVVFGLLFLGVIGLGVGTWMAFSHPDQWVVETTQVSDSVREQVVLEEVSANSRTMDLLSQAYRSTMVYTSGPMVPQNWIIWILILAQAIAWPLMLAGATDTKNEAFKSFWLFQWDFSKWFPFKNFLFYFGLFLYLIFMLFSNPGAAWVDTDISRLISLGLSLPVVAIALLFQFRILKLGVVARFLSFTLAFGAVLGIVYATAGFNGLYQTTVNAFPFMLVMFLLFLFWTGTDLTNLLYFVSTNAKNKKLRLPFWGILPIYIALLLMQFVLLHNELDLRAFDFIPTSIGIRPIHLILLTSLVTVFTSQNIWPRHKKYYESPTGFSYSVLGFLIFSLGTLFAHIAQGEYLFLHLVERIGIIFYFSMGLFHVIFLHLNFFKLLKRKVNFYFLTKMPTEVDFFFVVLLTLMVSFSLEAREGIKTKTLFHAVKKNRQGDLSLVRGDLDDAFKQYTTSKEIAGGGVKSNYNRAMIRMAQYPAEPDTFVLYSRSLKKAESFRAFPHATLNRANILTSLGKDSEAELVYRSYLQQNPDARIYNNLALIEFRGYRPDSAIAHLKQAILLKPDESGLYANLSQVYLQYDFSDEVHNFAEAALETPQPSPIAVTNALFQNIRWGDSLNIPAAVWEDPAVIKEEAAQYNYALERFKAGDYPVARTVTDSMLARTESPEGILLDGMLLAREDSFLVSIDRFGYLESLFPGRVSYGNHFLGIEFFRRGIPEMASESFRKSASGVRGLTTDSLHHAQMELDMGNYLEAMQLLGQVRVHNYADPVIPFTVQRELGILHKGLGNWLQAGLEWDFEGVTADEYIRMGKIAAQFGDLRGSQNIFQEMIVLDSTDIRPYLEMGRLNLAAGDSMALLNLQPGLKIDPDHVPLRIELMRAHLQRGQMAQAIGLREELKEQAQDNWRFHLVDAQMNLVQGDTANARKTLERLNKENPMNVEVMKTLGAYYRTFELDFKGFYVFYDASQVNSRNPEIWYYLAVFSQRLGQNDDAGYCALKAIEFTTAEERKVEIGEEFAADISIYSE